MVEGGSVLFLKQVLRIFFVFIGGSVLMLPSFY